MLTRRNFLTAGTASLLPAVPTKASAASQTLRQAAASRGLLYGAAVAGDKLDADQSYAGLLRTQAGILVAEGATKRRAIQPTPTRYDFSGGDKILAFAQANGQLMRGHTLVWHQSNPDWLVAALESNPDEKLLTDYITRVVQHYRGKFHSWDVANEVVDPSAGWPDGMRGDSPWFKAFGEHYIDLAFHTAREADPNVPLFLNETGVEVDIGWSEKTRAASLALVDRLIARKVPVTGYGIQGHLKAFKFNYSDEVFSRFLDELGARGLKVLITEFDIADIKGPADQAQRDAATSSLARRFLDVAFSKPFVEGCLTWGITDRYSWLSSDPAYKWPNGQLSRGLPFDGNYQKTSLFDAMMNAYGA